MRSRGQTATEYMLLISVVVVAVAAAAYLFVPTFRLGVTDLATDTSRILGSGEVGGIGMNHDGSMISGTTMDSRLPPGGPGPNVYNAGPMFNNNSSTTSLGDPVNAGQ